MPHSGAMASGELLQVLLQLLEAVGMIADVGGVIELLLDDHIHDRVQHGDVGARLELQHVGGMPLPAPGCAGP